MAGGIPAAEFLGICIIMADYDLGMNMLEVVRRVDTFENITGKEYGTGRPDFHCSFNDLYVKTHAEARYTDHIDDVLRKTTLKDWVRPILSFQDVWFNDEGEYWQDIPEDADWPEDKKGLVSWTGPDGELHYRILREHLDNPYAIKASLRFDRRLRELFEDGYPGRQELMRLFRRGLYARRIPYYWSRYCFNENTYFRG